MLWLSASKLKTFRNCPASIKAPFKTSPATQFGEAVHAGIAAHLMGQSAIEEYRHRAGLLSVPIEKEETAVKCIDFAKSLEIPQESIITIESADGEHFYHNKPFFAVPFTSEWGIRGAMDCVYCAEDGGLVIVDWKTGLTQEEDDLQLAIYALCAWKKYGQFPYIKTVFAYVQQGFTKSTSWTNETLCGALDYLVPLANEYLAAEKANKWPEKLNKYCVYCALKDSCEACKNALTVKQDVASYEIEATPENLPKIIACKDKIEGIAKTAYAILEKLKTAYEQILQEHGTQTIDGRTYELKEKTSRYNYDLEPIFLKAQELIGRPPLELCEYSSSGATALKKELDKEKKKIFDEIIKNNRTVKSTSKTLNISIAKTSIDTTEIEAEAEKEE